MLKVGMSLTLEPLDNDADEQYKCKVADFEGDRIYIDYPINTKTNRTTFLVNSMTLNVVYISENNVAYKFRTQVIGKVKKNIPLIILHFPGADHLEKIQRRQFVRIETAVDVSVSLPQSKQLIPTITEDISAGGCAVLLPRNIKVDQNEEGEGLFVLPLQTGHVYLRLPFSVIRMWESDGKNVASLKFLDISAKEKQSLLRFCFERQLEHRKKGLLS
ncbi:pilus assembly protein PilZ [Heyndrickxia shackletonii]|uniref:Pilus assembly protein PilZ n=1 Tax=Heyndrickxia shackletonii TaxID=157838 RepID=A0A0Q3TIC0_9BACI|nr:flagellar brake domain-containing protein [Heyndrickxia shackletonii]KQL53688.1 pilus assembly protein PilZ [Heyndrickxia shackletonii]MBB2480984.1 flagellar brake domain-containing protein [Bacillus sp. APMAM]NEY99825.1 pilus assembly protein PilZ [Heyndrickxia shackletonii]RTZ55660.1 pilus assembly protein PilZ [Bacillus sp. SAJ1]